MTYKRESNYMYNFGFSDESPNVKANSSVYVADKKCCQNCSELKSYIDSKFNQITDMIQTQNAVIIKALRRSHRTQIKEETRDIAGILSSAEENEESLSDCTPQKRARGDGLTINSILAKFPLETEEELVNIDETICAANEALFIDAVKSLICNQLRRNIHSLLGKDIILDYNLEGTHGKTRFREFKNFYNVLKQAVITDIDGPEGDSCIRKAFQHAKRHYYKLHSMQKRNRQSEISDPFKEFL